ncbi:CHAT domain-containing protein [Xanthobacter autotrophicus]|uniref:CHAT domain-containing protein n=1 Tax=Xanthobacter autotrophicus TaxID=280 RepID=UPI0024A710F1|nr:CHAT domain-containing protein [Xanthobacter autotrophicus]MDI4655354.1 CHAT domain-containing protein [Xanthobacter autotrophicus]
MRKNDSSTAAALATAVIAKMDRRTRDTRSFVFWHNRAGLAYLVSNEYIEADEHYEAACAASSRSAGVRRLQSECKAALAYTDLIGHEIKRAANRAEQALALAGPRGRRGIAGALAALTLAKLGAAGSDERSAINWLRSSAAEYIADQPQVRAPYALLFAQDVAELVDSLGDRQARADALMVALEVVNAAFPVDTFNAIDALEQLCLSITGNEEELGRDPKMKMLSEWMAIAAFDHPNHDGSGSVLDAAVTLLLQAGFIDDAVGYQLRWQDLVERQFGPQSEQAWDARLTLVLVLQRSERHDEAARLLAQYEDDRAKALRDGDAGRYGIHAGTIRRMVEQFDQIKDNVDNIAKCGKARPSEFDCKYYAGVPMSDLEDVVAQSMKDADALSGSAGVGLLLDRRHLVERIPMDRQMNFVFADSFKADKARRESQASALNEAAYQMIVRQDLFKDGNFYYVLSYKTSNLYWSGHVAEAVALIDDTVDRIKSVKLDTPDIMARAVRLYAPLGEYCLKRCEPAQTAEAFDRLGSRLIDLLGMEKADGFVPSSVSQIVQSLLDYASLFAAGDDAVLAARAIREAKRISQLPNADLAPTDLERIDVAYKTHVLGQPALAVEAEVRHQSIAVMSDTDPKKIEELKFAASHFAAKPGGEIVALDFIRMANNLNRTLLKNRLDKLTFSRADVSRDFSQQIDPDILLELSLLTQPAVVQVLSAEPAAQRALNLIQLRDAGGAADALVRSAARAVLDSELRDLARELDVSVVQWRQARDLLIRKRVSAEQDGTNLTAQLTGIGDTTRKLDLIMKKKAPLYTRLVYGELISIADLRALIAEDEGIVFLVLNVDHGFFSVVLTRRSARVVDLGEPGQALELARRLSSSISERPAAFDMAAARGLYNLIFKPLRGDLNGLDRIVVFADPSTVTIPFAALLEDGPDRAAPEQVAPWLVRSYAISQALSIPSFVASRSPRRDDGRIVAPFLGFADPIILPEESAACPPATLYGKSRQQGVSRAILCPLPQTLDQVGALAGAFGSPFSSSVVAGAAFTKSGLRERIAKPARVIAFATHGLLSDQALAMAGVDQPALRVSPETSSSVVADRWLTAGEIEGLTLDSDLVVLSACNTAGGTSSSGGQALSGLVRAFFEAGTRGVLFTNWSIDARRTRELLDKIAPRLSSSGDAAGALRAAMLGQMESSPHPRDWAIFSYIGK